MASAGNDHARADVFLGSAKARAQTIMPSDPVDRGSLALLTINFQSGRKDPRSLRASTAARAARPSKMDLTRRKNSEDPVTS